MRVRFCPSPTGNPHVGLVRTALFNWAYARHCGGTFVFRIEDTDQARDSEESYAALLDAMRWLGLDWDEGPDVGGPHAPYRQSQRMAVYADVARRLRDAAEAYECFCTQEEVVQRGAAAGRAPGYDGHCRDLSAVQRAAYEADGRSPVLRLRMPDRTITFEDLVRGEIAFAPEHVPDFVLVRANGQPLYPLVNPVDDALMGITHVLRGEDLLSSTPRQIALYEALHRVGVGAGTTPAFGHLPYVLGEGNRKLSKRDPESSLLHYRQEGFLPEGLLNYLALLGWSLEAERDLFSLDEMVAAFDVRDVNRNPARFDPRKLEAVNGDKIRALSEDDLAIRLVPFLAVAGLVADPPTTAEARLLSAAVPLIHTRLSRLREAIDLLRFLFVAEEHFTVDPTAAARALIPENAATLTAAADALEPVDEWTTETVQAAIDQALLDGLGLKRGKAYTPVRVAVTGSTVAPPLPESMALLGRKRTLRRLRAAARSAAAATAAD